MLPSVELDDLPVVVKFILQSVGDNDAFEVRCMNITKCAIEIKKKLFPHILPPLFLLLGLTFCLFDARKLGVKRVGKVCKDRKVEL